MCEAKSTETLEIAVKNLTEKVDLSQRTVLATILNPNMTITSGYNAPSKHHKAKCFLTSPTF